MLKLGETGISKLYLGETPISKAYLGENLVWKKTTVLPYLDFNVNGERRKSRYFDTGVIPTANTTVEWCFGIVENAAYGAGGWQNGVRTGWISNALMFNFVPNGSNGVWYMWNSSDYLEHAGTVWQLTDDYVILRQEAGGKVYINGTQTSDFDQNLSPANYSLFIGDVNENGTAKGRTDSQGSGRLFWVKFYESGTLTHHYIPEEYNNQAGLYDAVADAHLQSTSQTSMTASSIQYGEVEL